MTPVKITDMRSAVQHAEQFLQFVHANNRFEIRGLQPVSRGPVASGIFTDCRMAALYANKMAAEPLNVYFSLNAISPRWVTLNRVNTARPRCMCTPGDAVVDERRTMLIDFDPIRPTGQGATDAQVRQARALALKVRDYLSSLSFPDPILLFSGNGFHLLYRLAANEDTADIKYFLNYIGDEFDSDIVRTDRNVFNAGRISRLPGCLNHKAGRVAHVLEYPDVFTPAPVGQQARAWGFVPRSPSAIPYAKGLGTSDKIERLIEMYPEIFSLQRITDDGSALWYACDPCPFSGETHNGMNVGKGKACLTLHPDGNVSFRCFHDSCAGATFFDVLQRAQAVTGRPCTIRFWEERPIDPEEFEAQCAAWGGIDSLT